MFLMIFSYFMLCEFDFYETNVSEPKPREQQTVQYDDEGNNISVINEIVTTAPRVRPPIKWPSSTAYLLIIWIVSFIMEEIRQVGKFNNHLN